MIDFRYHLVSIVSIFVALAVGIVLGAGPLQGGIGTQLTDQVSQLRKDMETLRSERDDSTKIVTAQEDYAAAVASSALAGRLKGKGVVLVVTPDTAGKFAEETTTAMQQAGATVTSLVTLKDAYRAPDGAADRQEAATAAAAAVGVAATADADQLLARVLAAVLVKGPTGSTATPSASSSARPETPAAVPGAAAALRTLSSAGLLDVSTDAPAKGDLVVVLGGPIAGTADSVTSQTATLTTLLSTLDSESSGLVVAAGAPTTTAAQGTTTNLVTAVRADKSLTAVISSVDHADSAVGAGVVVLALAEQASGKAGQYGISAGAKADVPTTP